MSCIGKLLSTKNSMKSLTPLHVAVTTGNATINKHRKHLWWNNEMEKCTLLQRSSEGFVLLTKLQRNELSFWFWRMSRLLHLERLCLDSILVYKLWVVLVSLFSTKNAMKSLTSLHVAVKTIMQQSKSIESICDEITKWKNAHCYKEVLKDLSCKQNCNVMNCLLDFDDCLDFCI